jgi:putative Ig domain-containing protein
VANPDVANPDVANPDVANVNTMNPDVANPDVANALVSDATYTATNVGNTTASYRIQLVGSAPASARLQLIVNKSYLTPVSANCVLREETQNTLQTNILHPTISDGSDLGNPDVANPDVANATFSLQPGENALITLRGNVDVPTMKQIVAGVTPVIIAHAANTGTTTPVFSAPLTIRTTALPDAFIARPYAAALEAFGGTPPYSWSLPFREGGLPSGLRLSTDGVISGAVDTESQPGIYTFTVQVDDAAGNSQRRDLTIEVVAPLSIRTTILPDAFLRQPYNAALEALGGTPPYSWNLPFEGGLPGGLVLSPAGIVSGTPDASGIGHNVFTVEVTDSVGNARRGDVSIDVIVPLEVITASFPTAIAGFYYSTPPALAGGGTRPYSWAVSGLPEGLDFDRSTGAFSGSIANAGESQVTLTVTDSAAHPQQVSRTIDLSTTFALLTSGPGAPTGGDLISRGFYIPEYPGSGIGVVELAFGAITSGLYEFRLTVRTGSYDGPIIATSNSPVSLPASELPNLNHVMAQFVFNEPVDPGTLVTFSIDLVSGPEGAEEPYYAVRCGGTTCGGPAIETEDTTPRLSVFRRNGVWIAIIGAR